MSTDTVMSDTTPAEAHLFPASAEQSRMWLLDRLDPGASYVVPWRLRLDGPLDVDALADALTWLVARHEALRTVLVEHDGAPMQLVVGPGPVPLPVVEVADDAAADAALAEQTALGFDLGSTHDVQHPLLRAVLLRVGDGGTRHQLCVVMHHAIVDAWSVYVMTGELLGRYADSSSEPRPPAVQYPDYSAWQVEQDADGGFDAGVEEVAGRLVGAPTVLALPTDRPYPAEPSIEAVSASSRLDPAVADLVRELAAQCGGSTFSVLLASAQALLHRLTGQRDVLVGTPLSGRARPETVRTVGLFVNTAAVRSRVEETTTFRELVAGSWDSVRAAVEHQEVPFDRVVQRLAPERSLAHAPLVQAFVAVDQPGPPSTCGELVATSELVSNGTAKFDLSLSVRDGADGMAIGLDGRADLLDPATVVAWVQSWAALLADAVRAPDTAVDALATVPAAMSATITDAGPVPAGDLDGSTAEVVLAGGGTVTSPDTTLDSDALRAEALRIAHLLRATGVGHGDVVALCLDRTALLVPSVLGVWLAGAAYLPLDPEWPPTRLAGMLADAGARVLLTDAAVADRAGAVLAALPADAQSLTVVDQGAVIEQSAASDADGELPAVSGEDVAYLIYTSGSTGRPKGVAVPHRAVRNLLASFGELLPLGPDDRWAAVTTLSFDISVLELLLAPSVGATTIVVGRDETGDGLALSRRLTESGATVLQATPATWRMLLAAGGVPTAVGLRLCGGEVLPRDLADALLTDPGAQLWNVYGPTETTVWSTAGPVAAAPAPVTIGVPIGRTTVAVLDARATAVPVGVIGELYIGGAGVALGYHRRPELTAERFVADPDGPPGALRYATGDLARWRADGTLELLGRADHQVKVRGHRIELGEIEAALRADAGVADAVVLVDGTGEGARLVAHLVGTGGEWTPASWAPVRDRLATTLPGYMIPTLARAHDALPLTANGKTDRTALAAVDLAVDADQPGEAPRTDLERAIAALWAEVLEREQGTVCRDDDFFHLGGHSLTATRLLARIREEHGVELPLRVLFTASTVAGLAEAVGDHAQGTAVVGGGGTLLERLDELSDDEVDALLDELLAEEGSS